MTAQIGAARFTLAHVAKETGLSAATLVQRFGSKRGLLLAVLVPGAADVEECLKRVRARHWILLAAPLDGADELAATVETADSIAIPCG